jgi:hypothetical protein
MGARSDDKVLEVSDSVLKDVVMVTRSQDMWSEKW